MQYAESIPLFAPDILFSDLKVLRSPETLDNGGIAPLLSHASQRAL